MRALGLAIAVAAAMTAEARAASTSHRVLSFDDLDGWSQDDHGAALAVFQETCRDLRDPDWSTLCMVSATQPDPRLFFELFFRPVLIENGTDMLFTGYYEPELKGARYRGGPFQYPIYALPDEAREGPWLARAELEQTGAMAGRNLELAWLADPVDVYFLQVQGSGRIRLDDGTAMRVGYAGKNGHPYRSVGKEMIRQGLLDEHSVSADGIRDWVRANGDAGLQLLHHNPSYVFFREVSRVPADRGPLGAMNRSVTAGRSLAVDPDYTPLGAPVWIEKQGRTPMRRLMVAQDTGAAIKGAQRADIFFGTGPVAGKEAGTIRDGGRMVVLMPIQRAHALAEGL